MKNPQFKSVATVLAISLLLASAFTLIIQAQTPTSTFWVSPGAYPGGADYTIWREGSEYFAKTQNGYLAYGSTNFTYVLENCFTNNNDVLLLEGEYVMDSAIILNTLDNCSLRGAGIDLTEIVGSADGAFIKTNNAPSTWVSFFDLTMNNRGLNTYYSTVSLQNGTEHYTFERVKIVNSGHFLLWGDEAYWLTVENCDFSSSGLDHSSDLVAVSCYDSKFIGNTFTKLDGLGGGCLTSGGMWRVQIRDNNFYNHPTYSYAALSLENYFDSFENIVVSGNVAIGLNYSALFNIGNANNFPFTDATVTDNHIVGGGIGMDRIFGGSISNNIIRDSWYGITGGNLSDFTISGNTIINTAFNDAPSSFDKGGMWFSPVWNLTITDNVITDNQGASATTPFGIHFDGNYSIISNNKISNTLAYGVRLSATAFNNSISGNMFISNTWEGVNILAGATNNYIHGNYFIANVAGDYVDAGTGTEFRDNFLHDGVETGGVGPAGPAGTTEARQPYDYLVFRNATSTYMINGVTGAIDASGSPSTVINTAVGLGTDILLASNTFTLTADTGISITDNGVTLRGMGYGTSIECGAGFDDHIIHVEADYVTIKDLTIDGTNQASSYHGIVEDGNGNGGLFVHHVTIEDCGSDGIRLGDTDGSWEANWGKIHHVILRNNGQYGIYFTYDATDSEFMDMLISGHDGPNDAAIRIEGDNIRITTGHLWGNEYEMIIAEAASVRGLIVSNLGIMDGGSQGQHRIYHASGTYNFYGSVFTGCEIWVAKLASINNYDGFSLTGNTYAVSITGCVFRGDNEGGTAQGRYGIDLDASCHNMTITANIFHGFAQADPIETTGAQDITESANIVWDCG